MNKREQFVNASSATVAAAVASREILIDRQHCTVSKEIKPPSSLKKPRYTCPKDHKNVLCSFSKTKQEECLVLDLLDLREEQERHYISLKGFLDFVTIETKKSGISSDLRDLLSAKDYESLMRRVSFIREERNGIKLRRMIARKELKETYRPLPQIDAGRSMKAVTVCFFQQPYMPNDGSTKYSALSSLCWFQVTEEEIDFKTQNARRRFIYSPSEEEKYDIALIERPTKKHQFAPLLQPLITPKTVRSKTPKYAISLPKVELRIEDTEDSGFLPKIDDQEEGEFLLYKEQPEEEIFATIEKDDFAISTEDQATAQAMLRSSTSFEQVAKQCTESSATGPRRSRRLALHPKVSYTRFL